MSTAKVEAAEPAPLPSTAVESTKAEEQVKMEVDTTAPAAENGDSKVEANGANTNGTEKAEKRPATYGNGVLKTTAREDPSGDRRKNNKFDPSVLPETDDPVMIRNQVEFYFGDSNLPGDRFLWDLTAGTDNLPVKVEKICEFGRMKRFRPITAVVAALRQSKFLEVTGPEGLEEVKRRVAYDPTAPRSKGETQSIYAKGFGNEEPSTQFDVEAFFAPYGPTTQVRLRRTVEKLFKGSVFVEFQTDELAAAFLALDPKPLWKGEHTLKIMSKRQYQDEKEQEIKDGKIQPGPSYTRARGRGRGRGGRGGGDRGRNGNDRGGRDRGGDRDPDDWKRRREDDRANGYKDDRNRRDNKGGRGRGRRDDRGPRNNDRKRDGDEDKNGDDSEKKAESKIDTPAEESKSESTKREREDGGEEGAPAKKVDIKSEAVSEAPGNTKKRAHGDDGEDGGPAKKVDVKSETATES